jgi:CRP-like cAMP-binding protein
MASRRSTPLRSEDVEPRLCTIHRRLEVLSKVPFFTALSPEDISAINRLFRPEGYTAGETIYLSGDPAKRLYVVATGKVKLLRHTLGGQDVLLDILAPGEFFGSLSILGDDQYADTAQAHTSGCVLGIGAEDFQTILQTYPTVAIATLTIMAQRLQSAHETIRQLSAFPVAQRVASVLLKLAEKLGEQTDEGLLIQMPLARQDLADMTGTTLETVSRVMSDFHKQGLIRSGRQWVAISDLAALSAAATET